MRWAFWRKPPEEQPEEPQAPEWGAWVLARTDKGRYEVVFVERPEPEEPVRSGYVIARPLRIMADPLDIAPAFHAQYEKVYTPHFINLEALRKNARTFKLQAHEIVTDPKRVIRRHTHNYLARKREERILEDSRLFI